MPVLSDSDGMGYPFSLNETATIENDRDYGADRQNPRQDKLWETADVKGHWGISKRK